MEIRNQFDHSQEFIHLNNAGITPLSLPCQEAMIEAVKYMGQTGAHGYYALAPRLEVARKTVADFINVKTDQVAFVNNCSTAISIFAFGIPMNAGSEIILSDQEYPSNRYPWHSRAKRDNLVITEIKSESDGKINWDKFISSIGPKTKVVAISWVQYATGVRAPLKQISEKAKKFGAVVVVDVIQGLGAIPFDFKFEGVDAICCGSHKWLCAQIGHGFLAVTLELSEKVYPFVQGALTFGTPDTLFDAKRSPHNTAGRFESGGINIIGSLGLAASINLFQKIGQENIYSSAMGLRRRLTEGLKNQGVKIVAEVPDEQGSPIVTFLPKNSVQEVANRLSENKISFAPRFGGIRVSPHAFNTKEEIDRLCQIV
ncbi:MAG: hypothetical protein A4S09_03495 [Proteobacteria bacterium SG_bin7]|nr:MAG: hypothetical protein A4S09_03495 [Proteobacteria bacterium SG_bin7]